jgi:hypothetical protein
MIHNSNPPKEEKSICVEGMRRREFPKVQAYVYRKMEEISGCRNRRILCPGRPEVIL